MYNELDVSETKQIIKASPLPDLLLLKQSYELRDRDSQSVRNSVLLKLVKEQIKEYNK